MNAELVAPAQWVTGRFLGDRAVSVNDHANAGVGYFVLDQGGKGKQYWVLASFRRVMDSPLPDHLTIVDPYGVSKLEERLSQRKGSQAKQGRAVPKAINDIFMAPTRKDHQ